MFVFFMLSFLLKRWKSLQESFASVKEFEEKKKDIWLSPMTKKPYTHRKIIKATLTQKRHSNFDYTTIATRIRTVNWSDDSNTTEVF